MSLDEWLGRGIPDAVMDAAIDWIVALDESEPDLQLQQRFATWLDADPLHRWAFEELSRAWSRTRALRAVSDRIERSQLILFPAPPEAAPPPLGPSAEETALVDERLYWLSLAFLIAGLVLGY